MISREFKKFSQGLLPLLKVMYAYWSILTEKELPKVDFAALTIQKNLMSEILSFSKRYPNWIFSYRFNPFFRENYQYFLLKLELLAEITFSSHYLVEKLLPSVQLKSCHHFFIPVLKKNCELMDCLIHFFIHQKIEEPTLYSEEFDAEIFTILEKKLYTELPSQLTASNLLLEEECLINYHQGVRDIHRILLELIATLPR